MSSEAEFSEYSGAVGWIIDRTGIHGNVLAAAWLVSDTVAVSCAHPLIPFFEAPSALVIKVPGSGKVYGVEELKVHSGYDPWMAKRNLQEVSLFPALAMANTPFNLAAMTLREPAGPMSRKVDERLRVFCRDLPPSDAGLCGQATRQQITSIIQTLLNAHNQGTLTLYDSHNLPVARFFIKDMKITHIQYKNYINEEALFSLLTSDVEKLTFFFIQEYAPDWTDFSPIEKSTTLLLMNAYTRLEETEAIIQELGGPSTIIQQTADNLSVDGVDLEHQPAVACVWNHIKHPVSLARLSKVCRFDGSIVMKSARYLVASSQAAISQSEQDELSAASHLTPANVINIERGTEISCWGADRDTGKLIRESGYVLDELPDIGPDYYAHSIGLPDYAIGSPIVSGNEVIGIHCGLLVRGAEPFMDWFHPGLLISAEAIYQCIDFGHGISTSEILTYRSTAAEQRLKRGAQTFNESSGQLQVPQTADHITSTGDYPPVRQETAKDAHRTSAESNSLESNRAENAISETAFDLAEQTQSRLEQESTIEDNRLQSQSAIKRPSGFFNTLKGMFGGKSEYANDSLELMFLRQGLDSDRFEKTVPEREFPVGDMIRMRMKALVNHHLVVLFRSQRDSTVRLLYPPSSSNDQIFSKGEMLEIPESFTDSSGATRRKIYAGLPINNEGDIDVVLIVCAKKPLLLDIFEAGIDDIFNAYNDQLMTGKAFATAKFRIVEKLPQRVPSASASGDNHIDACRIELRHTR